MLLKVICVPWSYATPFLMPFHTIRHTLVLRSECMLGVWISLSYITRMSAVFFLHYGQMRVRGGDRQTQDTLCSRCLHKHTTAQLQKMNNSCVVMPGFTVEEALNIGLAFKPNPICKGDCCIVLCVVTQRAHVPVTPPLAQRNLLSAPLLLVLLPSCPSTHLCMLFVCKHAGTCPYCAHMLHFTACMPLFTGLLLLQLEPLPTPPFIYRVKSHQAGLHTNMPNVTLTYYI